MENLEIIVSDSTIYNNISRIYGQNFIDNYDEFLTFSMKWVSRNADVLGSKNLGKRVTFYDADENEIFRIFNVDKKVISEIVKKSTYVDKKWQISIRPLNVLQYVLIFFYLDNKHVFEAKKLNTEPYKIANMMLSARFFSTIQRRQFKYEPDDNVMFYTLENLSNKFTITKLNSIYEMIVYIADTNLESMLNSDTANSRTDNVLDSYMRKLNTRISSNLVNISRVFYENHKNQKKVYTESNTVEFEDGKKDLATTTSVSNDIEIVTRRIIHNLNTDTGVDVKSLRLACNKTSTSYSTMLNVLQTIKNERDERVENIIKNIISYFLVSEKANVSQIKSYMFFNVCISAYRISNSKNEYIIKIKEDLNSLLNQYSQIYFKSNRPTTKANFRACLYLYIILSMNRLS